MSLASARNKGKLSNRIVEGNIHPGLSISEQTDLWVNVSKRRIVPVEFVGRPENTLIVTVKDDFFSKFGKKLGEIYCIYSSMS